VSDTSQRKGVGTELLSFIKFWFITNNKTGCRFILVDAYAEEENSAIRFYEKNGFKFLSNEDKGDKTRLMYFDLITLRE